MIQIRDARPTDLETILELLMDDDLGKLREDASDPAYQAAFHAIEQDPCHRLIVAEQIGRIGQAGQDGQLFGQIGQIGTVVGCFQLSFIPGLSRRGGWRGQIENVRVARSRRGNGIGREMMLYAIKACQERGCRLVQLTTDRQRTQAHNFYKNLGFQATHEGMKLRLE